MILTYAKPSTISTPYQGVLNQARELKRRAWKDVQMRRARLRQAPIGGDWLGLMRAESAHKEALRMEQDALRQIERRANELGKTTYRQPTASRS